MRRVLPLLAGLSLAFAPAPPPRPAKPAPAAEVVLQVAGGIDRIDLSFGTRKELVRPDRHWRENLAAGLKRFREIRPAPARLIFRFDIAELAPGDYISLYRICKAAGYPELRVEDRPGR
jgi:hypothetical protein